MGMLMIQEFMMGFELLVGFANKFSVVYIGRLQEERMINCHIVNGQVHGCYPTFSEICNRPLTSIPKQVQLRKQHQNISQNLQVSADIRQSRSDSLNSKCKKIQQLLTLLLPQQAVLSHKKIIAASNKSMKTNKIYNSAIHDQETEESQIRKYQKMVLGLSEWDHQAIQDKSLDTCTNMAPLVQVEKKPGKDKYTVLSRHTRFRSTQGSQYLRKNANNFFIHAQRRDKPSSSTLLTPEFMLKSLKSSKIRAAEQELQFLKKKAQQVYGIKFAHQKPASINDIDTNSYQEKQTEIDTKLLNNFSQQTTQHRSAQRTIHHKHKHKSSQHNTFQRSSKSNCRSPKASMLENKQNNDNDNTIPFGFFTEKPRNYNRVEGNPRSCKTSKVKKRYIRLAE